MSRFLETLGELEQVREGRKELCCCEQNFAHGTLDPTHNSLNRAYSGQCGRVNRLCASAMIQITLENMQAQMIC